MGKWTKHDLSDLENELYKTVFEKIAQVKNTQIGRRWRRRTTPYESALEKLHCLLAGGAKNT